MRALRYIPLLCLCCLIITSLSRPIVAAPDTDAEVALQAPPKDDKAPPPKEADKRTVAVPPATPPAEPTAPRLAPRQPPPELIGDASRVPIRRAAGGGGGGGEAPILIPRPAIFKIAENESPAPQDRIYFSANYFANIDGGVQGSPGIQPAHIHTFSGTVGLEKTFWNGDASLALIVPFDNFRADQAVAPLDGTSGSFGDLTVYLKYRLWRSEPTGSVLSGGLAVTAATGPDSFAGSSSAGSLHDTFLQPFLGYIAGGSAWYIQGFSSIAVPTSGANVTLLFNDIAIGYYLRRDTTSDRLLTAIVPTCEVHVTTPLNHRGLQRDDDLAATSDLVDVTAGTHLEFQQRTRVTFGMAFPVTGPRPFDWEAIVQLRRRF